MTDGLGPGEQQQADASEPGAPVDVQLTEHALLTADDLITDKVLDETEPDRLGHEPIARELAELALEADSPANIALFGPWGSGKSSLLASVRRILRQREPRVKTVRYDAWKYGGSALQRNFIFNAAAELGLPDDSAHRDYYRGLYESSRTADFKFKELLKSSWASIARLVALVLVVLAALWAVAAVIAISSGHVDVLAQLTVQGIIVLPWALLAPVGAGILQALMQGARVDFEQTAPSSDEQFSRTFRRLIKEAIPVGLFGRTRGRLVFLIDELDRCSPGDVAATLAALKTFLDEKDCVFMVAIDREVLERALKELPQASPVDAANPYYSAASSFIDKVFQHQISLPPLRTGRLTRLAGELVLGRKGIWGELAKATDDGTRPLDLVLYALIPSHVRSPRRVKILLNNFATSSRMAQARGIGWLARSAEMAKLVALQTEFPVFAKDLYEQPTLPSLLLNPSGAATLPDRARQLMARYAAAETSAPDDVTLASPPVGQTPTPSGSPPAEGVVALDPPIAELDTSGAQLMATIQNQQLGRYLQRTARIPDPGRDLLYLEGAGALVDIQDSALGQLVEDFAPDAPDTVIKELESRPPADQLKSLVLLMDMADREVGFERSNCIQALLGIADHLGPDVAPQADRVAESVSSYLLEQKLPEPSLAPALRLACRARAAGRPLEQSVIKDPRLLADRATLAQAADVLGELQPSSAGLVVKRLVAEVTSDTAFLIEVLPHMDRDSAAALLKETSKAFIGALSNMETTSGLPKAAEFAEHIWAAVERVRGVDPDLLADFNWTLLNSITQSAYGTAKSHATALLPQLVDFRRARHALVALARAPESDWTFWGELMADVPAPGVEDTYLLGAIKSILSRTTWAQPDLASACAATVSRIALAAEPQDPKQLAADLEAALLPIISARSWWLSAADRTVQTAIHATVATLTKCEPLAAMANQLSLAQLLRALPPAAPLTAETYSGLRVMGALLDLAARRDLVRELQASVGQPQPPVPPGVQPPPAGSEPLATVAHLVAVDAGSLTAAEWGIATSGVCAAVRTERAGASEIATVWLRLQPPAEDVGELALAWGGLSVTPLRDALKHWSGTAGEEARTKLSVALIKGGSAPDGWIAALAEVGLDEDAVVGTLQSELSDAKQFEHRERLTDHLLEVRPTTRSGQRKAGEFAIELLRSGKKNDFQLASRLGPALGEAHRAGAQLSDAFTSAISTHGWAIGDTHRRALEAAGIRIRRRSLRDRLRGRG